MYRPPPRQDPAAHRNRGYRRCICSVERDRLADKSLRAPRAETEREHDRGSESKGCQCVHGVALVRSRIIICILRVQNSQSRSQGIRTSAFQNPVCPGLFDEAASWCDNADSRGARRYYRSRPAYRASWNDPHETKPMPGPQRGEPRSELALVDRRRSIVHPVAATGARAIS